MAPLFFSVSEITPSVTELLFPKSIAMMNLSSVLLGSKISGFTVGPSPSMKKKVNAIPKAANNTVNSKTMGMFVGKGKKFFPPTFIGQSTPIVQNVSRKAQTVPVIPNKKAGTPILGIL